MKKNYRTLSGLPKFQRDNSSPTGFSSIEAGEDVDMPKPFNHYDPSTYPSNYTPQQRAKLIQEAKLEQRKEDNKHSMFSDTIKDPDIKRIARRLKYLSINPFIGSPYFFIKSATNRNLALRLTNPAKINIGNCMLKAPALIVNSLNGMGVNPAVKIIIKLY